MYEKYCRLRDSKGVRDADVSKATGITKSTFTDWKSGRSSPKNEKLQKIADYFGVPIEYFWGSEKSDMPYYLNDETREIAQFAFENPDARILFNALRKTNPENMKLVIDLVNKMS